MIKQRPAYESSDGSCHKTYEEAQKAELVGIFKRAETLAKADDPWSVDEIVDLMVNNAPELREILKPAIGRPTGSRNGSGRRRTSKTLTPDQKIIIDSQA